MPRICSITILFFAITASLAQAQDDTEKNGSAFNIGVGNSGLSFGNSPRHNGLRFNWRDSNLEEINGFNFTIWKPAEELSGTVNGLAFGIVGPAAVNINGVSFGGLAVLARDRLNGISIGGLAIVSQGSVTGSNIGGLAIVSKGSVTGLSIGGLAVVSEGPMTGLNIGGLALVGKERLNGINIGGLALVSEGKVGFINIGGLAVVGLDGISGVTIGGIGIVSKKDIVGLNVTLGELRSDKPDDDTSIKGINVAGYRIRAKEISGVNIGLIMTRAEHARGLMVGCYNRAEGTQRGISIGLYNHATELFGIQIGVLNYAENNPEFFRLLPLLNLHF